MLGQPVNNLVRLRKNDEFFKLKSGTHRAGESVKYTFTVTDWQESGAEIYSPYFVCSELQFRIKIVKKDNSIIVLNVERQQPLPFDVLQIEFGFLLCHPTDPNVKDTFYNTSSDYSFVIGDKDICAGWEINANRIDQIISNDSFIVVTYVKVLEPLWEYLGKLSTRCFMLEVSNSSISVILSKDKTVELPKEILEKTGDFFKAYISTDDAEEAGEPAAKRKKIEIDLSQVIDESEVSGVLLIFDMVCADRLKRKRLLDVPIVDIARALSLVDVLQARSSILQPLLEEKVTSFASLSQLINASFSLLDRRPLTHSAVLEIAKLKLTIEGENLLTYPLVLRGFQCTLCRDDLDDEGFCQGCKCTVYCVECYGKNCFDRYELDEHYHCVNCKKIQKYNRESFLKPQGLDWSIDVFKVFYPALYLRQAYEKKEFADIFKLKQELKFDLEDIPKRIVDFDPNDGLEIIKSLLPYIRMLISA